MLRILLASLFILCIGSSSSQVRVKTLDPKMMEGKVLYIQDYNPEDPVIQRWIRKGKDSKVSAAEEYASLWETVMTESSWDATPYEIKKFDEKKMIKAKAPKALLLRIQAVRPSCGNNGSVINYVASVLMTGPKKKVIAAALINDLEWWERSDLRLIVNMISNSLNEAIEAYEEEEGSKISGAKNAKKQVLVDFMEGVKDKTFLVRKSALRDEELQEFLADPEIKDRHKKKAEKAQKKALEKDEAVEIALKQSWKMSEYKMVFEDQILEQRDALSPDHYFWINIEYNTCNAIAIGANRNHLFSTDGDKVLAAFAGKGKMKASTVDNIQKKMHSRLVRYKKQLAK